jgi:hypothetical protein
MRKGSNERQPGVDELSFSSLVSNFPLDKTEQIRYIGLFIPHRKHIRSTLQNQLVNAVYRFVCTSQETYYLSAASPTS